MPEQNTDVNSLAHTKWNCKYHVVFAPKLKIEKFNSTPFLCCGIYFRTSRVYSFIPR